MGDLTLDFIQNVLKEDYPDVILNSFEEAPGSKRGDNYTSMVYRITLKGTRKVEEPDGSSETTEPWEGSVIYKCLPKSTLRREAFKSDDLFCNEVAFYNKIWPALSNFQKHWQQNLTTPFKAIPKCYLAQNDLVILKDLRELGFTMPDRRQGLTVEQCYYVLKNLSHFHALSLAMKYQVPEEFFGLVNVQDGISEVLFASKNEDYYKGYYREAIANALQMVDEELQLQGWEVQEKYMTKFRDFCSEDTFFSTMVDVVAPREPLAVICHGDCWTNNLLFRYINGDIAELYLVDFQLARYASPALDLAYLLYLGLTREQRAEHLHSLLEYYTDELHKRLLELSDKNSVFRTTLNKAVLSEMLQEEFKRSGRFGLGIALDMYPIVTCNSNEAPNVYQTEEVDLPIEKSPVWTVNRDCKRKMADLLQELVDAEII